MTKYRCSVCGRALREVVYRDVHGRPMGPVCVSKLLPIELALLSAESLQMLHNPQKRIKKMSGKRREIKCVDEKTGDLFDEHQSQFAVA